MSTLWAALAAGRSVADYLEGYPSVKRWQVQEALRRGLRDAVARGELSALTDTSGDEAGGETDRFGRELGARRGLIEQLREIIGDEHMLQVWLISQTGSLGGDRPIDHLQSDPGAVLEAARQWMEPLDY